MPETHFSADSREHENPISDTRSITKGEVGIKKNLVKS